MIGFLSTLTCIASILSEETQEEADARILAEAKAYVAGLSDEEFEAWVVNMEKMGRFLEIAKIMRIEWLIERMQSLIEHYIENDKYVNEIGPIVYGTFSYRGISVRYGDDYKDSPREYTPLASYVATLSTKQISSFCVGQGEVHIGDPDKAFLALRYSTELDNCVSNDDTRKIACLQSSMAFNYALTVDKGPHKDTREAACRSREYAVVYAINIDKCPRDDTRAAASTDIKITAFHWPTATTPIAHYDSVFKKLFPEWYAERGLT